MTIQVGKASTSLLQDVLQENSFVIEGQDVVVEVIYLY